MALGDIGLRLRHRLLGRAPRPEAVAVLAERRVPQRLKPLQHRLLDHAVYGRTDPDHGIELVTLRTNLTERPLTTEPAPSPQAGPAPPWHRLAYCPRAGGMVPFRVL